MHPSRLAILFTFAGCLDAPDSELAAVDHELRVTVDPARELVITDPSVIAAPIETTFDPTRPSGTHRNGAWSFGRLIHNMLPAGQRDSRAAASKLVMDWLRTWESDQAPNPEVSAARARACARTGCRSGSG